MRRNKFSFLFLIILKPAYKRCPIAPFVDSFTIHLIVSEFTNILPSFESILQCPWAIFFPILKIALVVVLFCDVTAIAIYDILFKLALVVLYLIPLVMPIARFLAILKIAHIVRYPIVDLMTLAMG